MSVGQSSPLSPLTAFTDQLRAMAARIAELERAAGSPFTASGYVTTATTDSSGFVTVTHGLTFTPVAVVATPRSTNHTQFRIDNISSTTFRYRAWSSAGVAVNAAAITFQWVPAR